MSLKGSNYPTVRPSLDLQFAQTKRLDPRISYSRSGVATYYDETGTLRTAQANEARFDHDLTTGESLGLLVEEARTNSQTYSNNFATNWTLNQNGTAYVIPNAARGPSGQYDASKLVNDAGAHIQGPQFIANNIGFGMSATFDLSTKTVTTQGSVVSASITEAGNGWFRCAFMPNTGIEYAQTIFAKAAESSVLTIQHWAEVIRLSTTGGLTGGILIWGAQVEAGSFPTSYIPTPVTFTSRSTTATYYDASGIIQAAGVDVARDDAYFPDENGVMRPAGLLLEEARTNVKTNSQVFTSGWNSSGIDPITQNTSITTPEGLTDGVGVITESSGGTVHQIYSSTTVQYTGYYTYSIFVKPNGRNYIVLCESPFTHNLSDGTTTGSPSGEFISAKTEKLSNGWYRCSLVRLHNNTFDQFNLKLADGPGSASYSGDGVSGVYIWGAQQEAATYATSYIPTDGTPGGLNRGADVSSSPAGGVTRTADVAQITGSNFSSWYNSSEGSLVSLAETPTGVPWTNAQMVGGLWNGSYAQGINGSGMFLRGFFASNKWQTSSANWLKGKQYPIAGGLILFEGDYLQTKRYGFITWDNTSSRYGLAQLLAPINATGNGAKVASDQNTLVISGSNIDTYYTLPGRMYVKRLSFYPVRLPDATLQKLTE